MPKTKEQKQREALARLQEGAERAANHTDKSRYWQIQDAINVLKAKLNIA